MIIQTRGYRQADRPMDRLTDITIYRAAMAAKYCNKPKDFHCYLTTLWAAIVTILLSFITTIYFNNTLLLKL